MIKISAINIESEEESVSEEEVTKEALQQIALQEYTKALDLQRKGNLADATQLLKDLLDTELLYDVKKPVKGEKVSGPLFNLKYLCYKNLASLWSAAGEIEAAIEAYTAASDFDDTDITLWHRFGLVCMQGKNYEMALKAFQRGVERNPRHWPCLDKVITLLLAFNYKEECISHIHDALQLDPGYMRGIVYRRHIYTLYRHMREYMVHLNPIYKWNEQDDDPIDEEKAAKFLKEAEEIHETVIKQQKADTFKYMVPNVKLQKPITSLTWESVGESLVHMHNYMTEYCFSHACFIKMIYKERDAENKMDISEVINTVDDNEKNIVDTDKNVETVSEIKSSDLSDKDKASDSDKAENDVEMAPAEPVTENVSENKIQKKASVRRRGSAVNSLETWDWWKPKLSRKKQVKDSIYDILRKLVPLELVPENVQKEENPDNQSYTANLNELFDQKEKIDVYFGTDNERKDVKTFIDKYVVGSKDIIDMLHDYLTILAEKWQHKWPERLLKVYVEANKCYNSHIDIPACSDNNQQVLIEFVSINMLAEEFVVNEKLNSVSDEVITHDLNVIVSIEIILTFKPTIFVSTECLEMVLRSLWLKLHINLLNKNNDLVLECLYQLLSEFEAMGEYRDDFNLNIINFTYKPNINKNVVQETVKILERSKSLSTVIDLYNQGKYEEVLPIITDSYDHCKTIARDQVEEMPLDFAVQLSLIVDTYWALDNVHMCFKWSFICLHEALKHCFRFTSGSDDYDKWSLVVEKILKTIEHILSTEGHSCLEAISQTELSRGLEDLIRIIGHQLESSAFDMPFVMPFDTVSPWIIMYYILQREEEQGRSKPFVKKDAVEFWDEIPNPLKVLFIGHEHLGDRGWCCNSEAKLLFFILDTIVPRLRSSCLAQSLKQVNQHVEQCVFCLYGYSYKKNKNKHLKDHNVIPLTLDWKRAQQLYEIFRPSDMPKLTGKISAIVPDVDCLFLTILSLLPPECDPSKYVPETEKYIKGIEKDLPLVPPLLPYNMKDIYFLLGDFYFKKEDYKMSIKYNTLDVVINNDRFISWSQISLAKAYNLQKALKMYKNFNNEREFLNPAKSIIRCFKRSLDLGSETRYMWIEYGSFVYIVHSFCSRLLKQASESLSMENFEALEKQKEEFLNITHKCFSNVEDLNNNQDSDKCCEDKEDWLLYYMLGKIAEKQNVEPSVYLKFYMQAVKSLQEADAVYPTKINYNTPKHLCMEVLELQYRIHASILKYIEQHENKSIPTSVGKIFLKCIEEWKQVSFTKNPKKHNGLESDNESKLEEPQSVHAANILKRSISDAGEEETYEAKRLKKETTAAKARRSASYDIEQHTGHKNLTIPEADQVRESKEDCNVVSEINTEVAKNKETNDKPDKALPVDELSSDKKEESSSTSSSSSSSNSGSSSSSSDSSSSSSTDTDTSSKSSEDSKPISDEEITKIVSACLDALEDCASRYSPNYKALYRLAHYHYYKKGREIERCRDIMLSTFTSRSGQKINGLFYERKKKNFFNNIWTIKAEEVARPGAFAFHMNRAVLLTFEILKEIDDHKTLLDLSLYLHEVPDLNKKYLRDSDRQDLAKQAFSLSVQSLRGQLLKFSQQADLKTNDIERQALKSLMVDIYRAHNRAQKQLNSKQFLNLIVDAYKLISTTPITDNVNLVDVSLKYCHSLNVSYKMSSNREANFDKIQNIQKKQSNKGIESSKIIRAATSQPKADPKPQSASTSNTSSGFPKISAHDVAAFQNYIPMLKDQLLSQQTAAALSYYNNISALAGYQSLQSTLQSSLQTSLQNTFQAEFYRQFLEQNFAPYNLLPQKKQKRGPKPSVYRSVSSGVSQMKHSKPYTPATMPVTKATPIPVITSVQKSTSNTLAPSMGTVLSTLPASMTANLSSFGSHGSHLTHSSVPQAHMSSASSVSTSMHSKPPMPHQQVSPGKTLQEKLAERQKSMPAVKSTQEINASISRLPSSLTITKTSLPKSASVSGKKPEAKKSLSFGESEVRPKPISSDEVIVLDDD